MAGATATTEAPGATAPPAAVPSTPTELPVAATATANRACQYGDTGTANARAGDANDRAARLLDWNPG